MTTLHVSGAIALVDAGDEARFGGKAAALAVALRAGLPVPGGVALSAALVGALLAGDPAARQAVADAVGGLDGPLAVRSSAIGEDGAASSFAGQHLTELNVLGAAAVLGAVAAVGASAAAESAVAYRSRVGAGALGDEPCCGVVVQHLVAAEVAGVLFTRNPVTGADERVIEASWALGEAVVSGLVTPDCYRVARDGTVLGSYVGHKDVAVVALPGGGTETTPVDAVKAAQPCLGPAELAALNALAADCERVYGGPGSGVWHDLEWAFHADGLTLLQRRPVTA